MAIRYYFSKITSDGEFFVPIAGQYCRSNGIAWVSANGAANLVDVTQGIAFIAVDATLLQHATIEALPNTQLLPIFNDQGDYLTLDDPISAISNANQATIVNAFEARSIPLQGINGSMPIGEALQRVLRRWHLRRIVQQDDLLDAESLDLTISQIPAGRRSSFQSKLVAAGIDLTGITGSSTLREALQIIIPQLPAGKLGLLGRRVV